MLTNDGHITGLCGPKIRQRLISILEVHRYHAAFAVQAYCNQQYEYDSKAHHDVKMRGCTIVQLAAILHTLRSRSVATS